MKLRLFTPSDIPEVSSLHQKNLNSPGSKLGTVYLNKFYGLLLINPKLHVCLLLERNKQIIGVVTATTNLKKTTHVLKGLYSLKLIVIIIKAIFLGRIHLMDILGRVIFENLAQKKYAYPHLVILTIVVDRKFQRQGVGRRLLEELKKRLKGKKLYVDTLEFNKKALAFYRSFGFKIKDKTLGNIVLEYSPNA